MKFIPVAFLVMVLVGTTFASPGVREARQTDQCPDVCLAVYDPVCASNNDCIRAFSNSCQLDVFNCPLPPRSRYSIISKHNCNNFATPNYYKCQKCENTNQ